MGLSETNHLRNVQDPSGWIYLRESAVPPDIDVIHVRNESNSAGTCIYLLSPFKDPTFLGADPGLLVGRSANLFQGEGGTNI